MSERMKMLSDLHRPSDSLRGSKLEKRQQIWAQLIFNLTGVTANSSQLKFIKVAQLPKYYIMKIIKRRNKSRNKYMNKNKY